MTSAEFGSNSNRYFNSMDCDICGNRGCEWCHNKPFSFKKDYVKLETNKAEETISKVAE
jgi:hypothetical protein